MQCKRLALIVGKIGMDFTALNGNLSMSSYGVCDHIKGVNTKIRS